MALPGDVRVELYLEVGGEGRGQLQHWLDVQHRGLGVRGQLTGELLEDVL